VRADEGLRKRPDQGSEELSVFARKCGPEDRKAAGGAPEGDAPEAHGRARRKAETKWWRLSVLHPLAFS
jgi:hypothetical protein